MSSSTNFESLDRLAGAVVPSPTLPGVTFRLERCIGAGGIGVVFLAARCALGTEVPVVMKLLRPSVISAEGTSAPASIRKEAVALGRLNEHVPPTPFVVRLVDAGEVEVKLPMALRIPWLAIEYVHGGEEGTTVEERVAFACSRTGSAFDPARTARALGCLSSGLAAIHDVGVVHRDITPGNVLCCGFGESEIFKISDFGLSRSAGMQETFGSVLLGTPGYAAPEQSFPVDMGVGPHSDVFSLAAVAFHLLTGESYFDARSIPQALVLAQSPSRKTLAGTRFLSPELRSRPDLSAAIDRVLASGTAYEPRDRPSHVQYFSAMLAPLLRAAGEIRPSQRHVESVASQPASTEASSWAWTVRHAPGNPRVIYSAAWDGDGTCLAATTRGLEFWDGVRWLSAAEGEMPASQGARFVHREAPGSWVVGGADGQLVLYTFEGVRDVVQLPDRGVRLVAGNGRLGDLFVAVAERPGGGVELWCRAARRWLKPLPVPQAASVLTLSRVDDERWLIAGRGRTGSGIAALFAPTQWELTPLLVPAARAYIASDGEADRGTGIVGGASGHIVHVERTHSSVSRLPDESDVSAAANDVFDRRWAASLGQLWLSQKGGAWTCIWRDPTWRVPLVRLSPDAGVVLALTADGGVLEGRARTA